MKPDLCDGTSTINPIALNKGEQLHHQAGWQGEVLDVQEMNGLLFYLVKNSQGEDVYRQ